MGTLQLCWKTTGVRISRNIITLKLLTAYSLLSSPFVVQITLTYLCPASIFKSLLAYIISADQFIQQSQMNSGLFRGSSYSIQTERDLSLSNVSEQNIKIAMVGIAQVGKSSIINSIEKEKFNDDIEPTTAFQLRFKKIKINRHLMVNLTIWDASGFRVLQYIKEGKLKSFDGIFYVYDLKSPNSVVQLQQFHEEVNRFQGQHIEIIIGNKADLAVEQDRKTKQYKIPESNEAFYLGNKFSQRHKMLHQNVSAKLNTHVTDIFVLMITEILNKKRQLRISRFEEEDQSFHAQQEPKEARCKLCQRCDKCNLI